MISTETEARELLHSMSSPACQPHYVAERLSDGWAFHFDTTKAELLVGEYPWVVHENGNADMVGLDEDIPTASVRVMVGFPWLSPEAARRNNARIGTDPDVLKHLRGE